MTTKENAILYAALKVVADSGDLESLKKIINFALKETSTYDFDTFDIPADKKEE